MFTLNFNICLWVFIIHATISTQCLGYDFTKMPFACDFLVTSTGQRCMCCSSPTGLGFLFFSSHASEGLWDFPFVASQKESPVVTQTPEAPWLQMSQDSPTLDLLVQPSDSHPPRNRCFFQTIFCEVSLLPLYCILSPKSFLELLPN